MKISTLSDLSRAQAKGISTLKNVHKARGDGAMQFNAVLLNINEK